MRCALSRHFCRQKTDSSTGNGSFILIQNPSCKTCPHSQYLWLEPSDLGRIRHHVPVIQRRISCNIDSEIEGHADRNDASPARIGTPTNDAMIIVVFRCGPGSRSVAIDVGRDFIHVGSPGSSDRHFEHSGRIQRDIDDGGIAGSPRALIAPATNSLDSGSPFTRLRYLNCLRREI